MMSSLRHSSGAKKGKRRKRGLKIRFREEVAEIIDFPKDIRKMSGNFCRLERTRGHKAHLGKQAHLDKHVFVRHWWIF